MAHVFIINAHHQYPFSEGQLNATLVEVADQVLRARGHETQITHTDNPWDVEEELAKHRWADVVLLQSPVNWMMVSWPFKKYMDEVYSAGMQGVLSNGDGRHRDAPKKHYGSGGLLQGKEYMLSLTLNAPREAFDDASEYLFEGRSLDDLFLPMHANFRFFGMTARPTFACFDVMKNPEVESDLEAFKAHLNTHF